MNDNSTAEEGNEIDRDAENEASRFLRERTASRKPEAAPSDTAREALIEETRETMKRQEWMPASLAIRLIDALERTSQILPPDDDLSKRRAAQVALLFPGIDPEEIRGDWEVVRDQRGLILTIKLERPVNDPQYLAVATGSDLIAHRDEVAHWTPGLRAEYRRQYFARYQTGSFHPPMTLHPDEVDRRAEENGR